MNYFKYSLSIFILATLLLSCSSKKTTDENIVVTQLQSSAPVYITGYEDSKMLLFFVPIALEISHNIKDTLKLDNCSSSNCNSEKMNVIFSRINGKFTMIDTDAPENQIVAGAPKRITLYRGFSLREKDTIQFKDFEKEFNFVKKNCNVTNNFRNDTITYSDIHQFVNNHKSYYDNRIENRCQTLTIFFHHYNKLKNILSTPEKTITLEK